MTPMDKKSLRNDIILIASLLLVAVISLIVVFISQKKESLIAKVYRQNDLVLTIDLKEKEEKDYYVDGLKCQVHIHTKENAIAIVESNCPHQDCVNMHYVSTTNRPIICAYNAIYIIIEGNTSSYQDLEI